MCGSAGCGEQRSVVMALTFNAEAFNVSLSFLLNSVFRDSVVMLELVGRLNREIGTFRHADFFSRKIHVCPEHPLLPLLIPAQMKDAPACKHYCSCP